jgi:hypothetical protein
MTPEDEAFEELARRLAQGWPTAPRTQFDLTDEEIDATWGSWMRPYAHMVLNKLKEKL